MTTDPGTGTPIEQTAKPANTVTADSGTGSACEPYREFIEQGLLVGRNAMSIWQELVARHGFTGAYETVKRFVRKQRGTQTPEARAVILTAPGEEAQVAYGTGPQVRDPKTCKYRRTRRFVLTLGFSRKMHPAAELPIQQPDLGRVARNHLPTPGRNDQIYRAR